MSRNTVTGYAGPVLLEIRVWMARRQMNQSELAARIGVAQSWVSKRLSGTVALSVDDLGAIAEALDVPAWEFLRPAPQPASLRRSDMELMQYRYPGNPKSTLGSVTDKSIKPAA